MGKKERTLIITILFLLNIIFLTGCIETSKDDDKSLNSQKEKFYVHEWGVFVKGYDCNETNVKAYEPEILEVDKPVIYFHSIDNKKNVKVEVFNIKNAIVIPYAETYEDSGENKITWDVEIQNDTIYGYESNGSLNKIRQYNYLFYEGNINYPTKVYVNITSNPYNNTYNVINNELFEISTVFVIKGNLNSYLTSENHKLECVYFGDLPPGSEKTIINKSSEYIYNPAQAKKIIKEKLLTLNFTNNESDELVNYWNNWFFYPQNYGEFTRIIYFIPQTIYDSLLPIVINPEPKEIIRAGIFVESDIPIYTPPVQQDHNWVYTTVIGTGSFTISYYGQTIQKDDTKINITNPNEELDVIQNPQNNTIFSLNNGVFKWTDETGDNKIGDNDKINIYSNSGLIHGTWNVKIIKKSTSEIIYDTNVTIG